MNLEDDGIQCFSFWKSWYKQCLKMSMEDRDAFLMALMRFAFEGIMPGEDELTPFPSLAFEGAIHTLSTNIKMMMAGRKGGINKGKNYSKKQAERHEEKAIKPAIKPPIKPPIKGGINDIDIDNRLKIKDVDKDIDVDIDSVCADAHDPTPEKTASHFTPPSLADVKAFLMDEKSLSEGDALLKAEKFVSFYESKGWMVGKNKMKNWKAAMSGWLARDKEESHAKLQESAGLSDTVLYLSKVI